MIVLFVADDLVYPKTTSPVTKTAERREPVMVVPLNDTVGSNEETALGGGEEDGGFQRRNAKRGMIFRPRGEVVLTSRTSKNGINIKLLR